MRRTQDICFQLNYNELLLSLITTVCNWSSIRRRACISSIKIYVNYTDILNDIYIYIYIYNDHNGHKFLCCIDNLHSSVIPSARDFVSLQSRNARARKSGTHALGCACTRHSFRQRVVTSLIEDSVSLSGCLSHWPNGALSAREAVRVAIWEDKMSRVPRNVRSRKS